ncbi:MAG TPA: hypothetical protein VGB77_13535 [Abditibacteriaceae bacterium]|jgi:hypothetical protein
MSKTPQTPYFKEKDEVAMVTTFFFLPIGLLILWFAKTVLGISGDAVLATLVVIPVLIYCIISGRIKGFKGPGGIEATFLETASQPIKVGLEKLEPSNQDMQIIEKASLSELEQWKQQINDALPVIMTLHLGNLEIEDQYSAYGVIHYLDFLSQFRNFRFIVFLGNDKRFIAYMQPWVLKGLLNNPNLGYEFIHLTNAGQMSDLRRFPGLIEETVTVETTNSGALAVMTKHNLDALIVVDGNRQLKGVVDRNQILSKMMLALGTQSNS